MKDILVIGSGIVGLCSGIELIERGHSVTLIDLNDPGSQTSYGICLRCINSGSNN